MCAFIDLGQRFLLKFAIYTVFARNHTFSLFTITYYFQKIREKAESEK